ncbi:hypothetical protein [Legionella sp. WA2024007413]
MKFIINKKNSAETIVLTLEPTTTVKELLLILYTYRSKIYDHFSFKDYQKFISVYQCLLYGDRFKNKLLPKTNLADYGFEDPCYLTWEESTENRNHTSEMEPTGNRALFWQANIKPDKLDIGKESYSMSARSTIP